MHELKAGDLVRLKSGGPVMTIEFWSEHYETFVCSWFTVKHERQQQQFQAAVLTKVEEEPEGRGEPCP